MKEIICSGKRIKDGKWIEGFYVKFYSNGEAEENHMIFTINEAEKSSQPYNVDPETVCRCTGLTDKNGRKIFEGDIVKQFADCNESGKDLYYFYQIRWNKEYCAFDGYEIYTKETFLFPDLEDIEVVGNIYDNPELLKGVQNDYRNKSDQAIQGITGC